MSAPETWSMDAVLHARLATMLRMRDLEPADWMGDILRLEIGRRDETLTHASTMGPDHCGNYEVIDEPCAVRIPLRVTLDHPSRLVHVRELPFHPNVTYANYPHDEEEWLGDEGDEHDLWRRPIVMVEGLVIPDGACAALAGRKVGDIVDTGLVALDEAVIAWGAVEPPAIAAKVLHGRRASQPTPASLILRLEDVARIQVEAR
jgi:hypothetical protein